MRSIDQYEALLHYCKQGSRQEEIIKACITAGSNNKAAKLLGCNRRNVDEAVNRVERLSLKTVTHGDGRQEQTDNGFSVKGTSRLYDEAGNLKIQWVKTDRDKEQQAESLITAFTSAFDGYKGESKRIRKPKDINNDMLSVYPMGDPHIGMYAWAEESGEDFDCDIAEKDLCDAIDRLVERSPASETAIILNLGDFFHSDTMDNRTARSGHALDVDTRWARVLHIGARAMIQCVYSALKKHKQVIVKNIIGNHDDHTSQALSLALSLYFENNKRVIIDTSPSKFWYYQHGQVLIGSTHGDTAKPDKLGGIMATDKHKAWGETKYRYWYTGHIHTKNSMELHGCLWESFRTLAAKDAWHAGQGYRSGRDMQSIHLHKDYGESERHTINIDMLRGQ